MMYEPYVADFYWLAALIPWGLALFALGSFAFAAIFLCRSVVLLLDVDRAANREGVRAFYDPSNPHERRRGPTPPGYPNDRRKTVTAQEYWEARIR